MKITKIKGVRKNGKRWMLDFTHNGERYRPTTILINSPENLSKAQKILNAIHTDLERATLHVSNYTHQLVNPEALLKLDANYAQIKMNVSMTSLIDEQINILLQRTKNNTLAEATFKVYKYAIDNHLYPFFDKTLLGDVSTSMLEEFIKNRLKFSKSRIRLVLRQLRAILERAKDDQLIPINPFDQLNSKVIANTHVKSNYAINPFSQEEINLILEGCKHQGIKNLFQFAFWTGCRPGEIFQLRYSDIDFKNEIIHVNKGSTSEGQQKTTKTSAGERQVEMTPKAKEALINQLQITGNDADQIIFKTPVKLKPWKRPSALGVYWKKALDRAHALYKAQVLNKDDAHDKQLSYRNLYQTRCTFISTMLTLGNSPMILYPMVGHKTPQTIYDHYARFITSGKKLLKVKEEEE